MLEACPKYIPMREYVKQKNQVAVGFVFNWMSIDEMWTLHLIKENRSQPFKPGAAPVAGDRKSRLI